MTSWPVTLPPTPSCCGRSTPRPLVWRPSSTGQGAALPSSATGTPARLRRTSATRLPRPVAAGPTAPAGRGRPDPAHGRRGRHPRPTGRTAARHAPWSRPRHRAAHRWPGGGAAAAWCTRAAGPAHTAAGRCDPGPTVGPTEPLEVQGRPSPQDPLRACRPGRPRRVRAAASISSASCRPCRRGGWPLTVSRRSRRCAGR